MDELPLDIDISLTDANKTLTPLRVANFNELASGSSLNRDYISFEIKIKNTSATSLIVKISHGTRVIFQEALSASMFIVGNHKWNWDGFNALGKFDSKMLKQSALIVELIAATTEQSKSKTLTIRGKHAEQDWVDVKIDKNSRKVEIELRAEITDGGSNGVGESPPDEVKASPVFNHYPPSDIRRRNHVRLKSFNDLKALLLAHFKIHWSRKISGPAGLEYDVVVNPVAIKDKAMDDISIEYNTNRDWLRSSNPGSVRGIYSLFGNFVPERIAYNIGWVKYSNGWGFVGSMSADKAFGETAAHELGHEILSAYGGDSYSYSHKGSSSVISQTTKKVANGGVVYPASGEIDIMKYYNGSRPTDFYSRVYASEQDVKSLLWLSRIQFS